MQNTTLVTINNDIELTQGGSPEQLSKVKKQIRFIKDVYKNFPLAVVAGGAPLNHMSHVAARDIDIYVGSIQEAEAFWNHYAVVNDVTRLGQSEYNTAESRLAHVFEAEVRFKKDSFLVNLMVQPTLIHCPTRLERCIEVIECFSFTASMNYYCDIYGDLLVGRQWGSPLHGYHSNNKYANKLLYKLLLLSYNEHSIYSLPDCLALRTARAFRSLVRVSNHIFKRVLATDTVSRSGSLSIYPSVSTTTTTVPNLVLRAIGLASTKQEVQGIYDRLYAEAQAAATSARAVFDIATAVPSVSSQFFDTTITGARSLSQNRIHTWATLSQLQSGGRTDTEVARSNFSPEAASALSRAWSALATRLR